MASRSKATKAAVRAEREASKKAESAAFRRLVSARILNDCVEQFHVFSTKCEDGPTLLGAFERYQAKILSALQLRRDDTGDVLEADILLINADWVLEQSCATHHEYWRYVPELKLTRLADGTIVEPKPREGVATYAVWTSYAKKSGVVVAKDVHKSPATTFHEEVPNPSAGGIKYRPTSIGDLYKPPADGTPPYRCILSVPMARTVLAHGDPLKQPDFDCLGVLNLTHSKATAFSQQDFAWAMTCASLLGSLHASLYARLPNIGAEHPNESLLDWGRRVRKAKVNAPTVTAAQTETRVSSSSLPSAEDGFAPAQLKQSRIQPWTLLRQEEILLECDRIGDIAEKNILDRLQRDGVVLLRMTALTPEKDLLKSLENSLGMACLSQNDYNGSVKLITPDPAKEAISGESALELAAHVDGTQDALLPPAMLAFQYLAGATHGGHSTFFDMADVLREFSPAERIKIITDLAQHDAAECTKEKEQPDKTVWKGTYRGALVKPVCGDLALSFRVRFDRVMKVAPDYQESFNKLQQAVLARGEDRRITVLPREGDVAIFDNWRVMHGRLEVSGRHERHHNRIWFRELATRHRSSVLLGVRGLSIAQLNAIKQAGTNQPSI